MRAAPGCPCGSRVAIADRPVHVARLPARFAGMRVYSGFIVFRLFFLAKSLGEYAALVRVYITL